MEFTTDIDFTFFIIVQSISFDRNLLFVGMFLEYYW